MNLHDILYGPPDEPPTPPGRPLAAPQTHAAPSAGAGAGFTRERLTALDRTMRFCPQPGPQLEAWNSPADQLLFGGQAGGGKSALCAGLAAVGPHQQILIVRRQGTELVALIDEIAGIVGSRDGFNQTTGVWRLPDRTIRLGGVPNPGDELKWQGAARDLLIIDECCNLLESQVRFLLGWQRTTKPGQRVRAVFATNPPTSADGEWVVRFWAPWVDSSFPNPAKPGELRYVAMIPGEGERWVDGPEPFTHKREVIRPISRTFIPSRLENNVYLRDSGYLTTLQALPEPLRSQLLRGDWDAGRQDDDWQVIPSLWIKLAMDRWQPSTAEITSVGVDPSRGGDETTIAIRRGAGHFDPLMLVKPDASGTITGGAVARRVLDLAGDIAPIHVDVIGIGASVLDHLEAFVGPRVVPVNAAAPSEERDLTGNLKFANVRAAAWWTFRERLDPSRPVKIALPRDQRLFADLAAPRYRVGARGIQIEEKAEIKRRLGRSPDRGDAVVLAAMRTAVMFDHRSGQRVAVRRSFRGYREEG